MKLQFKKRINESEDVNDKLDIEQNDGRIEYKDFEIVPFHYQWKIGDDVSDVDSAVVVFKQKARLDNGELMDVVAHCENTAGMEINFRTVEEAMDYLDRYGDFDIEVRNGDEVCLIPKTDNKGE